MPKIRNKCMLLVIFLNIVYLSYVYGMYMVFSQCVSSGSGGLYFYLTESLNVPFLPFP